MKLLLAEDNLELAHWLTSLLREQQFSVDHVADGDAADRQLKAGGYDAALLDLNIPQLTGKGVLRRLRERGDDIPVLILTATASLDMKVLCLEIGADDYLVKPVEGRELVARIRALIRRRLPTKSNEVICGALRFDLHTRVFMLADNELTLPPRERAVLEALVMQPGKTVPKTQIMNSVFTQDDDASVDALDVYVHRLRKKLEGSHVAITTLRGVGYLLRADEAV